MIFQMVGSFIFNIRITFKCNISDAQKEIRDYASAVNQCLEKDFPVSWKALQGTF